MLNFTTTTFINSEDSFWTVKADDTATKKYAAGTASNKVELKDADGTAIKAKQTKLVVSGCPELYSDDLHTVCHVYKNKASLAVPATAVIDLTATAPTVTGYTDAGTRRIAIYIRLTNNNSSYYANDWVFKGKPLYIEFPSTAHAADVVKIAKKHMLLLYGSDLVKIEATDTDEITITGKTQWQLFRDQEDNDGVKLQALMHNSSEGILNPDKFVDIASGAEVTQGYEAFGDFAHVTKDLRLPTGANNRWYGIAAGDIMNGEPNDDKPNPGCQYTQYTVVYESERGIQQGDALGGLARSRTTHVFYVVDTAVAPNETTGKVAKAAGSDVAKSFEAALAVIMPTGSEIESAGYTAD